MKKKLTIGLLRQIIKEELNLSETSMSDDIGNDVSYEVDQIMGEKKISGWWCDHNADLVPGGLIWYNEKYGDRKKKGKLRRYYTWEVHSSPFFDGKPQFDMYIHPAGSNTYDLIAKTNYKPTGDDVADAKAFIKWFKSNIAKVEAYISKNSNSADGEE